MKLQHIRNATVKITYAGKVWLIDPFFADPFSLPPFAGKSKNPIIPLPFPIQDILEDVDHILITHLHPDHFDAKAREHLHVDTTLLIQPADAATLDHYGFQSVQVVDPQILIDGVTITRVPAQHGQGKILQVMGAVSGFIFESPNEPTLYVTGDSIWCTILQEHLDRFDPQVIICNAGGNAFHPQTHPFQDHITLKHSHTVIMDAAQVYQLMAYHTDSSVVAIHIGALDHETLTRDDLKHFLATKDVDMGRFHVPLEGESLTFDRS